MLTVKDQLFSLKDRDIDNRIVITSEAERKNRRVLEIISVIECIKLYVNANFKTRDQITEAKFNTLISDCFA